MWKDKSNIGIKNIPAFENYMIDPVGIVWSLKYSTRKKLGIHQTKSGSIVYLSKNGNRDTYPIRNLMMLTFRGGCPPGKEIYHINGDIYDNCLWNLDIRTKPLPPITRSNTKLDPEDVEKLKDMFCKGISIIDLAEFFDLSTRFVRQIVNKM